LIEIGVSTKIIVGYDDFGKPIYDYINEAYEVSCLKRFILIGSPIGGLMVQQNTLMAKIIEGVRKKIKTKVFRRKMKQCRKRREMKR